MASLVQWHRQLQDADVSPLLRAPLVHLYFEWIHPFWDGNGRVGRVLEATLLRQAGYQYAPFALAKCPRRGRAWTRRQRDLKGLLSRGLIRLDRDGVLWPGLRSEPS